MTALDSHCEKQEKLEELEDINSYLDSKKHGGEFLPLELVEKMVLGTESKVKLMRCYRGYSISELAKMLSITESYLSQIEAGKIECDISLCTKLSKVLDVDLELLV